MYPMSGLITDLTLHLLLVLFFLLVLFSRLLSLLLQMDGLFVMVQTCQEAHTEGSLMPLGRRLGRAMAHRPLHCLT
jgi:hypothetical protein